MAATTINLSQRAPLIDGIQRLYQLSDDARDLLALLDDYCERPEQASLAKSLFDSARYPELLEAFLMVSPDLAKPLYADKRPSYLAHLQHGALKFLRLGERAQTVAPNLGLRLAERYVEEWLLDHAKCINDPAVVKELEPILSAYPSVARELTDVLADDPRAPDPLYQRRLIDAYLEGKGPLELAPVASLITDDELRQLAKLRLANHDILRLVHERHGSLAPVFETYLDGLFMEGSGLRYGSPYWITAHPDAFRPHFLARLTAEAEAGRFWGHFAGSAKIINLIMENATPGEVAQLALCLRLRAGKSQDDGSEIWGAYRTDIATEAFRQSPPQPGEWGPVLKELVLCLRRDTTLQHGQSKPSSVEAIALLLNSERRFGRLYGPDLFSNAPLRTLTRKQYLDDLAWPVDQHSQVVDYLPTILGHIRTLVESAASDTNNRASLHRQLDRIVEGFARQCERLMRHGKAAAKGMHKAPEPTELNMEIL